MVKMILFFALVLLSQSSYSLTTKEALEAVGYSPEDALTIIKGGKRIKSIIDTQYKLKMLGYTDQEIESKMNNLFPGYKILVATNEELEPTIKRSTKQKNFRGFIREASRITNIPEALISAIIQAETNFDPHAVSKKGAVGLMQLIPGTAKLMAVDNSFDPRKNIIGGAKYLKILLFRFDNDLDLALAAYNAGPETVERAGRQIPNIKETRRYVADVKKFYKKYSYT